MFPSWSLGDYDSIIRDSPQYFLYRLTFLSLLVWILTLLPAHPTPWHTSWAEVALNLKASKPPRDVPHQRPCSNPFPSEVLPYDCETTVVNIKAEMAIMPLSEESLSEECHSYQESSTLCQADNIPVFPATELQIKRISTHFLYSYIIAEKRENNTRHSMKKPWFCRTFYVLYSIRGQEAREADAVPQAHTGPHSFHLPTERRTRLGCWVQRSEEGRAVLHGNMHAQGKW